MSDSVVQEAGLVPSTSGDAEEGGRFTPFENTWLSNPESREQPHHG